ncbi:MAG: collagen-like protein [Gammaproteobacteria bacterium]|nr:collagen-like protein [Gammaproteobacteria bacterium]
MKSIILFLLFFPSIAMAVDDATILDIDSKATMAKSKSDHNDNRIHENDNKINGNNSRIQALESEVAILRELISNIQLIPGPKGEKGDPGPQGIQGDQGPPGNSSDDRTSEVCDLYRILYYRFGSSNITMPEFCPSYVSVGDSGPAGGIVIYVADDGMHGLEAAPVDQSDSAEWGCTGTFIQGADGTGIGSGALNTESILAGCSQSGTAAELAANYSLNGYDDWYLPASSELPYLRFAGIGQFDLYWGSTQSDADRAWWTNGQGSSNEWACKCNLYHVRAIRSF